MRRNKASLIYSLDGAPDSHRPQLVHHIDYMRIVLAETVSFVDHILVFKLMLFSCGVSKEYEDQLFLSELTCAKSESV